MPIPYLVGHVFGVKSLFPAEPKKHQLAQFHIIWHGSLGCDSEGVFILRHPAPSRCYEDVAEDAKPNHRRILEEALL